MSRSTKPAKPYIVVFCEGESEQAYQGCPRCVSRSPVLGTPQSRMALWGEEKQRSD